MPTIPAVRGDGIENFEMEVYLAKRLCHCYNLAIDFYWVVFTSIQVLCNKS